MSDTIQGRILYVITKASWGGSQRYVFDLARAAKAQGYEAALAYGEGGTLATRLEEEGIASAKVPGLSNEMGFSSEFRAFWELVQLFRLSRPDVVHANGSKAGLAMLAARLTNVPRIIFTSHGWAFNEERPWWQKLVFRLAYVATIYLSHVTICVSEAVCRDMSWLPFYSKKLIVIRNGADEPMLKTRAESRNVLAPHLSATTWVGIIAELHPSKRIEDAIEAIADLKATHPNLALVVIGEGKERLRLEALVTYLDLSERVVLLGFVENANAHLKAFDAFILPSQTEALAYVLIEAGHAELPVVGTRVGGIPEIVLHKKTGLLVPSRNPAALARALRSILEDASYAADLAKNLRAHVKDNFSAKRMISDTLALYTR